MIQTQGPQHEVVQQQEPRRPEIETHEPRKDDVVQDLEQGPAIQTQEPQQEAFEQPGSRNEPIQIEDWHQGVSRWAPLCGLVWADDVSIQQTHSPESGIAKASTSATGPEEGISGPSNNTTGKLLRRLDWKSTVVKESKLHSLLLSRVMATPT